MSVFGGVLFHRFGVRVTFPVFFCIALTGSISLLFFGGYSVISDAVLVMLTKVGITIPLFLCYLANTKIFPAIYAGTAFGVCSLGAKICSIFAPMVAELDKPIPMSVFSVFIATTIVAALMLKTQPERTNT